MHGDEALPDLLSFSLAGAIIPSPVFIDRSDVIKESSLLEERFDDAELVRAKDGRGLRLGVCCAADAKYDAGLKERLAMLVDEWMVGLVRRNTKYSVSTLTSLCLPVL